VFDSDLAFSAEATRSSRVVFLPASFFTVKKRMEVRSVRRSSFMIKSRLKVSSSRPTERGSSPCLQRSLASGVLAAVARGNHADPFSCRLEPHYQPEASVRCELSHKHTSGVQRPTPARVADAPGAPVDLEPNRAESDNKWREGEISRGEDSTTRRSSGWLTPASFERRRTRANGRLAEGVGFEPTRGLHPWRFSRPLP
jgi:hypothetical protein